MYYFTDFGGGKYWCRLAGFLWLKESLQFSFKLLAMARIYPKALHRESYWLESPQRSRVTVALPGRGGHPGFPLCHIKTN